MPKRALTISRKVRAPLAFRFTADAMTEKKTIDTLFGWVVSYHRLRFKFRDTYVPQTPYHHPPATPNWYTTSEDTMSVALHVHAETLS